MIYGHEFERGWSTRGVVVGVAVGAVIGAGLGILLAPRQADTTVRLRTPIDLPPDASRHSDTQVPTRSLDEVPSV